MATISLNEDAPKDVGAIHFSFGNEDFELEGSNTVKQDDPTLLSSIVAHPWLKVEYEKPAQEATTESEVEADRQPTEQVVSPAPETSTPRDRF